MQGESPLSISLLEVLSSFKLGSGITNAVFNYLKHLSNSLAITIFTNSLKPKDKSIVERMGIKVIEASTSPLLYESQLLKFLKRYIKAFDVIEVSAIPRPITLLFIKNIIAKTQAKAKIVLNMTGYGLPVWKNNLLDTLWDNIYPRLFMFREQLNLAFKSVDIITCVSRSIIEEIKKVNHKVDTKKIIYLPNPIDLQIFKPLPKTHLLGYLETLSDSYPTLIFVGLLVRRKAPHLIPLFTKYALKTWPKLHFIVVGRGPLEQKFRYLIRKLGVQKHIILLNEVSTLELVKLYNISNIFFMPSYYEGFCLPVVEAMATGTPVVVREKYALAEHLYFSKAGKGFKNDNLLEIIGAINDVLDNHDEYKLNALRYAQLFDSRKIAILRMTQYEKLISR